jgi:hypothetical protein
MITQIGIVAGEIWHYLETKKKADDIESIIKKVGKPRELVLMSLGWLAREGHIIMEGDSPNKKVSLRII